ncbi:hypothetical protein [Massilia sp. DD77]|uniref:hypothetical protein n=1 Tax=Massilia sp. DD77 TaxID=3109349 RepID=UPI002FFD9AF2
MTARLRQYAVLWTAAVTHVRPRANTVLGWGILSLTVLGAVLGAFQGGPRLALAWAWCTPLALLLLAWAFQFMAGAVKLNTPANAQLAPAMRRRLAELAFGIWFLCVAGIAACPFVEPGTLVATVLWLTLFSLGAGLGAAGHGAGTVLIVGTVMTAPSAHMLPRWLLTLADRPAFLALELALLALAGLAAVATMLPRAGERHWRMQARRNRWAAPHSMGGQKARGNAGRWYAAVLRRDCARRDARSLLLHVLGLGQGRVDIWAGMLVTFVLGLVTIGLVRIGGSAGALDTMADAGWVMASGILFLPAVQASLSLQAMASAVTEQSLVRLTPLPPAAAPAFNRLLGRALLVQSLGAWAVAALAALILAWAGGATPGTLLMQACASCLALPMMAVVLRDHARRRSLRSSLAVLLLAGAVVACLGAGAVLHKRFGLPLMPGAAAIALVLAGAVALRGWRVMTRAPFAFPAGRMD